MRRSLLRSLVSSTGRRTFCSSQAHTAGCTQLLSSRSAKPFTSNATRAILSSELSHHSLHHTHHHHYHQPLHQPLHPPSLSLHSHRHHSTLSPTSSSATLSPALTSLLTAAPPDTQAKQRTASHSSAVVECEHCGRVLASHKLYLNHIIQIHGVDVPGHYREKCPHCTKHFALRSALQRHLRWHWNDKPHACSQCDKRFRDPSTLIRHVSQSHQGPKLYACTHCDDELFHTRHQARQHMELAHYIPLPLRARKPPVIVRQDSDGNERHVCTTCYLFFPTASLVQQHIHDSHINAVRPYRCELCPGTAFDGSSKLRSHMIDVHQQPPPPGSPLTWQALQCGECGRLHSNKHRLRLCELRHSGEKPFVCGPCGASFMTAVWLRQHIIRHRLAKQSEAPQNVNSAAATVASVRESAVVDSRDGVVDSIKDRVRRFQLRHSGEKPFVCGPCGASYTRSDKFRRHLTKHSVMQRITALHKIHSAATTATTVKENTVTESSDGAVAATA